MRLLINEVSKQYRGGNWGLRDFTLELKSGVVGLLGPNGAGKSTLMRIISTITKPTDGDVYWNEQSITSNPRTIRSILGYLPQDFGIYPNLNAVEFLEYIAAVKGMDSRTARKRIGELLQVLNLTEVRKRPIGRYSGGMRQRIGIAQALLNDPKLLIVDEPTVGLDPEERVRFRNTLADLSGERIVILSTHIVSDIESVATDIAVIAEGRLVKHGEPEKLLTDVESKVWELVIPSSRLQEVRGKYLISGTIRKSDGVHIRIIAEDPVDNEARPASPTLEDAYLYAVNSARRGLVV